MKSHVLEVLPLASNVQNAVHGFHLSAVLVETAVIV